MYAIHIAQLDLKQGQKREKKRQMQIDTRIPISSYNHVLLSWQFLSGWTSYSLNCPFQARSGRPCYLIQLSSITNKKSQTCYFAVSCRLY